MGIFKYNVYEYNKTYQVFYHSFKFFTVHENSFNFFLQITISLIYKVLSKNLKNKMANHK